MQDMTSFNFLRPFR